ncbi:MULTISPECIES: hypothetical protein [Ralstonia solanacearum species complex]|uniref:hypothetical protein n=1 Tax=Ralstonia solanacearum species complex TaxID=3116862 RepID=UPI000E571C89|nr:hypothetical protein [Ralstonia solanacearum]BEU72106.1 hypothetical protein MAFF211271_16610 [Ralstonia pseudosolanacearum]AXV77004.1 hypothetical protein CJO76_08470 [Ralstonia solanacearum]AXV91018.1 hypothetical protein CJO79_08450 [Ralstonia solanacearum]AXW19167.1 hypothetical protein CJO85_08500 [Ralstonia solanacearum]AXW75929.1 hypothetical protein CJO97_08445 [Ralstonia solanacearum]
MRNRIGSSSASTTTQNFESENAIEQLDTAIGNLQHARREATKKNPALALFASRNSNTDTLLQQASAISANHHRNAGTKNDAMPDSTDLINALNSAAASWMKA